MFVVKYGDGQRRSFAQTKVVGPRLTHRGLYVEVFGRAEPHEPMQKRGQVILHQDRGLLVIEYPGVDDLTEDEFNMAKEALEDILPEWRALKKKLGKWCKER